MTVYCFNRSTNGVIRIDGTARRLHIGCIRCAHKSQCWLLVEKNNKRAEAACNVNDTAQNWLSCSGHNRRITEAEQIKASCDDHSQSTAGICQCQLQGESFILSSRCKRIAEVNFLLAHCKLSINLSHLLSWSVIIGLCLTRCTTLEKDSNHRVYLVWFMIM